jgi:hypothetical protein
MTTTDTLIQTLLMTLIQVMVPVLLGFLVALSKTIIDQAKSRMSQEQLAFASDLARQLVLAAEQNGLTGAIKDEAAAKKEWVILRLESELAKRGVKLDIHVLSDLIEAAVHETFKLPKAEP